MNDQPMTRRDVVALLCYTTLVLNVVQWLLIMAHEFIVIKFLFPSTSVPDHLTFGVCQLASLLLWPFVPLMSSLVAEAASWSCGLSLRVVLVVRCAGLMIFLSSFTNFLNSLFIGIRSLSGTTPTTLKWQLLSLSLPLVFLSFGFALAFFPAIFDTLRHRMRDEENAA